MSTSMCPRPYRTGAKRAAATEQTRSRITEAALRLLMRENPDGFSIEAVAREADVARMTVYYQFGSKPGLLAAVFDELGARGEMFRLRDALTESEPTKALARFVDVFVRFYGTNRVFLRRLNALTVLDPELDRTMTERGGWRREALRTVLERFSKRRRKPQGTAFENKLDLLDALLGFEVFDRLSSERRSPRQVQKLLLSLAIQVAE